MDQKTETEKCKRFAEKRQTKRNSQDSSVPSFNSQLAFCIHSFYFAEVPISNFRSFKCSLRSPTITNQHTWNGPQSMSPGMKQSTRKRFFYNKNLIKVGQMVLHITGMIYVKKKGSFFLATKMAVHWWFGGHFHLKKNVL